MLLVLVAACGDSVSNGTYRQFGAYVTSIGFMYEAEFEVAVRAVKDAEKTFREYFGTKTQVETKQEDYRNLVSYADKHIEEQIRSFLYSQNASYGFVGEESGASESDAEYVWALDPIDGTSNYLQGIPECAISLALLKKDEPVLGIVSAPLLEKFYSGYLQGGALLNDKSIRVSDVNDISHAFGGLGWGRKSGFGTRILPHLLPLVLKLRVPGSAALGISYVASGNYDFFLHAGLHIWDYAAAEIILREAGGVLHKKGESKTIVAANAALADDIVQRFGEIF